MMLWNLLLLLILILPTIQYRVELGVFSFSVMEPFVLITAFLLFGAYLYQRKSLFVSKTPFLIVITALLVWTILTRPWSSNWQNGLSDIRDWLVPWLVFLILNIIARNKWERWYSVLLFWTFLLAIFGIAQHFLNGARPFISALASYKTGFDVITANDIQQLSLVSYAVGFSSHPNNYGLYMVGGFLLALGWVVKQKEYPIIRLMVLSAIGLGLYWSYAKSSILITIVLVAIFLIVWRVRSIKLLAIFSAILLFVAIAVSGYVLPRLPQALLNTFWWRVGLWKIAFQLLGQQPQIWLLGNGMDAFAQSAYYPQPHNLFIYTLLQYGIPGLILLMALLLLVVVQGWNLYRNDWFRKDPRLLGLWLGLLSYFAIGMTESTFFGIENRVIFLILLAGFEGLHFERKREYSGELANDYHLLGINHSQPNPETDL